MKININTFTEDDFFEAVKEKRMSDIEELKILTELLNQEYDFSQTLLLKLYVQIPLATGRIYFDNGKYLINPNISPHEPLFKNGTEEGMKLLGEMGFKIHKEDPRKKRQPRYKQRKEPIDFDKK